MTISSEDIRTNATATAGQISFSFDFKVYDTGDVAVYIDGVKQTSGFSVTLDDEDNLPSTGDVDFDPDPELAGGESVVMILEADYTQDTDIVNASTLAEEFVETGLDKIVRLIHQLVESFKRTPKLAKHSTTTDITFPEPSAESYVGWNDGGTDLENKEPIASEVELSDNEILAKVGGSAADGLEIPSHGLLIRGGINLDTVAISQNAVVLRDGASQIAGKVLAENEFIGRKSGDGVDSLTAEEVRRILGDPEHATGTDTYTSATNTAPPGDGVKITRDFLNANTDPAPTLDGKTMTTKDSSALWPGAVQGPHDLQYDSGSDTYLVLNPIGVAANSANAIVARDSNGRAKFADPSAAQDVATKAYVDAGGPALETAVDATNGGANDLSEIDFTSIAAGAKRITVMFDAVSLDGAANILVQIGDSGGIESSGYTSTGLIMTDSNAIAADNSTAAFVVNSNNAARVFSGHMVLTRISGNKWIASHTFKSDTNWGNIGSGDKELSAELDRLRIAASAGNFDGGNVNILVE